MRTARLLRTARRGSGPGNLGGSRDRECLGCHLNATGFAAEERLHRLVDAVEADLIAADRRHLDAKVGAHRDEVLVNPALLVHDAIATADTN